MLLPRRLITMVAALALGLATALIVGVTTPQGVSAQSPEDLVQKQIEQIPTTSKGEVKLSDEQRAEFTKQAKQVSGLSETEVEQSLADPKLFAGVATSAEKHVTQSSSSEGSFTAQAAPRCRTLTSSVDFRNRLGNLLHAYKIKKRWCYNGRRITAIRYVVDRSYVTGLGNVLGWKYRGIQRRQNNYFYALGNYRGGHRSYRRGFFERCLFLNSGYTCRIGSTRPVIVQRSYGNGGWNWRWSRN